MAYNVTSGSGAPQTRAQTVSDHSELQMLLFELKLKTSNDECLGVEMNNDQIVASRMIR